MSSGPGSPSDKILDRIQKLLALAGNNGNENEVAAAATKVQDMLLQHNLDVAAVAAHAARRADQGREPIDHDWYRGHRADNGLNEVEWRTTLVFAIARNNLCKAIHYPEKKQFLWIGRRSNIEVSQFLYETLVYDLQDIADAHWKTVLAVREAEDKTGRVLFPENHSSWRTMHGRTWKTAFFLGAIEKIAKRLDRNMGAFKANDSSSALVVTEDAQLNRYHTNTFGNERLGTYKQRNHPADAGAYATGQREGARIPFKVGVGHGGVAVPRRIGAGT